MGNEWGPMVLNNTIELEFIRQAQKGQNNTRSFWIIGSTNVAAREVLDFNSYINGNTGN